MNRVVKRLKAEAAELAANGILLQGMGDQTGAAVVRGAGSSTAVVVPSKHKAGSAVAIHVEEEEQSIGAEHPKLTLRKVRDAPHKHWFRPQESSKVLDDPQSAPHLINST